MSCPYHCIDGEIATDHGNGDWSWHDPCPHCAQKEIENVNDNPPTLTPDERTYVRHFVTAWLAAVLESPIARVPRVSVVGTTLYVSLLKPSGERESATLKVDGSRNGLIDGADCAGQMLEAP